MLSGELLKQHQAYYRGDKPGWQQEARLLQSLWRQRQGLRASGPEDHAGSKLADDPPYERDAVAFISPDARVAAKRAAAVARVEKAVMQPDRLWRNLLSSQPLCMNLFGALSEQHNDPRASRALARIWPDVATVTGIRYEWSPGRKDPRFLGNGTAFDVYVEYTATDGSARFLGIEVKYHEDLAVVAPSVGPRPTEVFERSGAFAPGSYESMSTGRNAQILLDHLLALSINASADLARTGRFVLLYPERNTAVADVATAYAANVVDDTFVATTLESVVAALRVEYAEPWVDELHRRYLDTSVIAELDTAR